ncbi:hypothetical protein [[Flexibacter] sp. ATCC 35208]|uniref:hypothetical protein n=1 Tax=[Flexibacter] sp. ATCC 35208 TaxID=1936242 RepID=UPI0009D5E590|nr:hypothetical protein [[Flexibacter] sp. ATCC 35208]OMP76506.1 hypothetical protein BW716_24635 [[Flexibacter] sp. ATCC 35208]
MKLLVGIRHIPIFSAFLIKSLFCFSQISTPKFQSFEPIVTNKSTSNKLSESTNNLIQNKEEEERKIESKYALSPKINQVNEENVKAMYGANSVDPDNRSDALSYFNKSFQQFLQINPDSFSITKAVYLSEMPYYSQSYSYSEFEKVIEQKAQLVKFILKQEGLNEKSNLALHYAIQKLFGQLNDIKDPLHNKYYTLDKIRYDFEDPMGENDWTKMFVTKLLLTNKGQCHSLPLLYLCISEHLGAKAYLSLSPNHSFIQFFDESGKRYNYETTNAHLVSTSWLMQSTYVNSTAYKNKTYLDTLSNRKLYAQCLADLLLCYQEKLKVNYDSFSQLLINKILKEDSVNLTALMVRANYYITTFEKLACSKGYPSIKDFYKFPDLQLAYNNAKVTQQAITVTGFQEMPPEAYNKWQESLKDEKTKEHEKYEQEKMNIEIKKLQMVQNSLTNKPQK